MTLDELKEKLNDLAWEEQMEFEMSERHSEFSEEMMQKIQDYIHEIAQQITPRLLDMLEQEKGYIIWVLRLSPYVRGDDPISRGRRFIHHPDVQVQNWAAEIMRSQKL
jgi:hypothetical protein